MHVHLLIERGDATTADLDAVLRELVADLALPTDERTDPDLDLERAARDAGVDVVAPDRLLVGVRDGAQGAATDWAPVLIAYAVEVAGGITVESAKAFWTYCLERYLHRRLGRRSTGTVISCEIVSPEQSMVTVNLRVESTGSVSVDLRVTDTPSLADVADDRQP